MAAGKAQIVEDIAGAVEGLTKRQAAEAFEAVVASVRKHLHSDGTVKVTGLGSFSISERASRKGRNPATGATITIKASKSVRFKAGKELKEAVNKKSRKPR
jgi:DNA-binding protein HU-beta